MKQTKVISAFPACGKTYYFDNRPDDIIVLDSDSSNFSWHERIRTEEELEIERKRWDSKPHLLDSRFYINKIKDEVIRKRNPEFPQNYIEYIKNNIGKVDYIFVSTHKEIRDALDDAGIEYTLVFPKKDLKAEWVGRCFLRGSDIKFCDLIATNWDNWIYEMEEECILKNRKSYRLEHGEYLSDALNFIIS